MAKYRIRVEVIEGKEELCEQFTEGMVANGFIIICKKGDGFTTAMHDVTRIDIARAIATDSPLMAASVLAKAMKEAKEIENAGKVGNVIERLFGGKD